jgi:hypothetical protein
MATKHLAARLGLAVAGYEYSTPTLDVRRIGFEPATALELDNEHSGHAI